MSDCVCACAFTRLAVQMVCCSCEVEKCRANVKENGNETTLRASKPVGIGWKRKENKTATKRLAKQLKFVAQEILYSTINKMQTGCFERNTEKTQHYR